MIAYEVLVQTIADWKAGARPVAPTPIPSATAEDVEELAVDAVDISEQEYVAEGQEYVAEGQELATEGQELATEGQEYAADDPQTPQYAEQPVDAEEE